MKILQVNKFYYPNRGADKYFLFLEKLLKNHGHEVKVFAMSSSKNLESPDSPYFAKEIDLHNFSLKNKIRAIRAIIYNQEAKRKFKKLLADFQPDIIHCHNIYHQLSPSILDAARQAKIPVVMHLHDYKLICPNYKLYTEGSACQRCKKHRYWECVKHRCVDNSQSKSLLAAVEMTIHHRFLKIYQKGVSLFIAPSNFMKKICVDFGWPEDKFTVLENISPISVNQMNEELKEYYLYFGALEAEKGIDLLIKAGAESKRPIKIAGIGKAENELRNLATKLQADVEFLGQLYGDHLYQVIAESLAVVIPSRWPENMPLAAIEAMGLGKTVIAADIGGLSELIKTGDNGFLFPPEDWQQLAKYLKQLKIPEALKIGERAAASRKDKTEDWHYQKLITIYQTIINKKEL
ncbi:MAG: glycosyltransferase [Patescibacteria group bacterium]|nr:glycosyltransferase [Patescibacteria group bacterium]